MCKEKENWSLCFYIICHWNALCLYYYFCYDRRFLPFCRLLQLLHNSCYHHNYCYYFSNYSYYNNHDHYQYELGVIWKVINFFYFYFCVYSPVGNQYPVSELFPDFTGSINCWEKEKKNRKCYVWVYHFLKLYHLFWINGDGCYSVFTTDYWVYSFVFCFKDCFLDHSLVVRDKVWIF